MSNIHSNYYLISCHCQLESHFSFYLSVAYDRLLEPEQYGGKGTRYGGKYGGRNVLYTAINIEKLKMDFFQYTKRIVYFFRLKNIIEPS